MVTTATTPASTNSSRGFMATSLRRPQSGDGRVVRPGVNAGARRQSPVHGAAAGGSPVHGAWLISPGIHAGADGLAVAPQEQFRLDLAEEADDEAEHHALQWRQRQVGEEDEHRHRVEVVYAAQDRKST